MDATESALDNADIQEKNTTDMKEQSVEHYADHDHDEQKPPEQDKIRLRNVNNKEGNDEADNAAEEGIENPYDMLFCLGLIRTDSKFVICGDFINVFCRKLPKNNVPRNPKTTSNSKIKAAKYNACLRRRRKVRPIKFNRWEHTARR